MIVHDHGVNTKNVSLIELPFLEIFKMGLTVSPIWCFEVIRFSPVRKFRNRIASKAKIKFFNKSFYFDYSKIIIWIFWIIFKNQLNIYNFI